MCPADQAKLWAVQMGLKLAWNKGFKKVVFETDSKVVEALLKNKYSASSSSNIIVSNFLGAPVKKLGSHCVTYISTEKQTI